MPPLKRILLIAAILLPVLLPSQELLLTAESNHSSLDFVIDIAGGLTKVSGSFEAYDMTIHYIDNDWTKSKFEIVIDANSIYTGIADRDNHLRSADFFDVEQYPDITFQSDSVIKVSEREFVANGNFTMHGITRPIELPFVITGIQGNTIGFEIQTSIDRIAHEVGHNFKHTSIENFLSDNVDVHIFFWTKKKK